ncbi:MAG: GIY-YIG nuclease family protein, partial [Acidimicrobiia bacterium]
GLVRSSSYAGLPSYSRSSAIRASPSSHDGCRATGDGMTPEAQEAARALADSRARLAGAETKVPRKPGLYAISGDPGVWKELGLGDPPDERPLYVGKAEESLLSRDIGTHFGNGRTGSSTVRRSFAALLRTSLGLQAQPRNPAKPGYFANYGLSPEHDTKLTRWMRDSLQLGFWAPAQPLLLRTVEVEVIRHLEPPLNLTDVVTKVGTAGEASAQGDG